jgi:hypothetical protein
MLEGEYMSLIPSGNHRNEAYAHDRVATHHVRGKGFLHKGAQFAGLRE